MVHRGMICLCFLVTYLSAMAVLSHHEIAAQTTQTAAGTSKTDSTGTPKDTDPDPGCVGCYTTGTTGTTWTVKTGTDATGTFTTDTVSTWGKTKRSVTTQTVLTQTALSGTDLSQIMAIDSAGRAVTLRGGAAGAAAPKTTAKTKNAAGKDAP